MTPSQPDISRILITGGAGCIGSSLVARLLEQRRTVRVFDPLLYGAEALTEFTAHPCFELLDGDPLDASHVTRAVDGVERVVHLGAIVGDSACAISPAFTLAMNVEATRLLVDAAREAKIRRFVFASTCSVYGAGDAELDERAPLAPKSLYAESKVMGEHIVLGAGEIEPVVLRFGTVFGPSRRPRFDLVVNLLSAKAAAGEPIGIHGGSQWRPFVHVQDIAAAIELVLDAGASIAGEIFNAGSDAENRRLSEVGEIIAGLVPAASVTIDSSSRDQRNYRANFGKITARLGFVALHSLRSGVQEVLIDIESGRIGDYREARFHNDRALLESTRFREFIDKRGVRR